MADSLQYPIDGLNQSPTSRRSRKKCQQCRRDHQKCLPVDRDWDEEQNPCLRCKQLGHPCGPSEIPPRRRTRNTQTPSSSGTLDMDGNLHIYSATAAADGSSAKNSPSSPTASHRARTSFHSVSLEVGASSPGARHTMQAGTKSSQPLAMTGRKRCEWECRRLLKNLGDMKALRRNLLFDMETMNELEQRLGARFSFQVHRSKHRAALSAIETETVSLFNEGLDFLQRDMGPYKECFLTRLSSLMEDFRKRSYVPDTSAKYDQRTADETVRLNQMIQNTVYQSHKKRQACSEAESICNALGEDPRFSRCLTLGSHHDAIAAYHRAAADLVHVFKQLTFEDVDYHEALSGANSSLAPLRRAYPAPQLAYRACDPWMAIKLWDTSPGDHQEVDALQRSLLHYAVSADDVQSVQHIARTHPQVIKTTETDTFGMLPLALAAMRNNTIMFNLLLKEDAPWFTFDPEGPSVLAVAAHVGNVDIVRRMLTFRPYPPLRMALHLAIESLHEGPARLILDCIRDPACYDEIGLETAASLAEGKGLYGLATDIRNIRPFFGTASDALHDVDNVNFNDMTHISNPQMPHYLNTMDWI